MRLLVLGGTRFLGRHLSALALGRGHQITLFHRGEHGADLFPQAERRLGDRAGDLAALATGEWDAVIDCSGQFPAAVRASAALLSGRAGHYTFISTVSVYADTERAPVDRDTPLHEPAPASCTGYETHHYGQCKAGCEIQAREAFQGPVAVVRPGLIVGPHDPTERFTWWVRRAARGGRMLAPGPPSRPVQLIDARDLAAWILDLAERRFEGTLDAVGPAAPEPLSFGRLVAALPGAGEVAWVDEGFLLEQGVGVWMELPLWVPETMPGFHRVDAGPAIAQGLETRDIAEIARDTAAWAAQTPADPAAQAGLTPEREAALLAAWDARG